MPGLPRWEIVKPPSGGGIDGDEAPARSWNRRALRASRASSDQQVGHVGTHRGQKSSKSEKGGILDEFAALAGLSRKRAGSILLYPPKAVLRLTRTKKPIYDEAVRQSLVILWEAEDRVCGKRLKALVPLLLQSLENHGHLNLEPTVRERLLAVSAATIDRLLA